MLKHVSPGDEITAEGYNSLVDAVGGPDIPTQKGFVKTANGAIFTEWSNLDAQANMRVTDAFKCAVGPAIRTVTTAGPWDNWNIPSGGEPESTLKHIYMYLGADNLKMLNVSGVEQNPFLNFNGLPPKYIAWSLLADNHIVSDKDFYVNNLDSDFDGNGVLDSSANPNIYHGWIETPFEPFPGAKIYGAFYKLLDSSGEGQLVGTIFILTYTGVNQDTGTVVYPIHSFTTFNGPNGENFIVGEQCTTPVLICEMQESQAMPGSQDATMESSKLVQHHTGPLSYQHTEQEAQGAWSIFNMVSGNEDGDDIDIKSYFEMKLSNASRQQGPIYPDFEIKQNVAGKTYLYVNNFQASGRQVVIELDNSNPVRYGVLTEDDFPDEEEEALPFVNICKNPKGFLDISVPYDAYLVIPSALTAAATVAGLTVLGSFLRGIFAWHNTLKCWELIIMEGERVTQRDLNDVLLAECRFDGTGTYTWFVPRNAIFQGSFSNLLRDLNIGDTRLGTEIESPESPAEKLTYNASIDSCNILSAVDEEGASIYEPTDAFNELSAAHPLGLQLFRFDKMNYTTPLSVGLTSAEISAEWIDSMDVVVRHRHFDPNDSKEGFKGSVIKYVPIKDLLSGEASCTVDVDAQYMATKFPHRYSIDWMPDADDDKVLQMYRFDESPTNNQYLLRFDDDGQIPQNNISADFVVREYQADAGGVNTEVNYQDGKEVVVPHEVTDGERYVQTGNGHVSTNYVQGQQGEPKALQLYNFNSYGTTSDANGLSANGDGILIRKKSSVDNHLELQYLNITGLRKLVNMPILSALDGLSVVTGIEYPMTGTNQYKIVAHRKQLNVVDNVLTITNLADQTIDTVAHDSIYPSN